MDVFPKNEMDIKKALIAIESELKNNVPKLAFLGMGSDGHTAGIFKENNIAEFCYDFQNAHEPFKRVTISMNVYLKIPTLVFLIFGLEKKEMLLRILSSDQNDQFIPIKFLLKNGIGSKTIICDQDAAPIGMPIGETQINF
jgi:6-phosphogluconolactonase/glucosamine-6-phosphate isomerase/deaminase